VTDAGSMDMDVHCKAMAGSNMLAGLSKDILRSRAIGQSLKCNLTYAYIESVLTPGGGAWCELSPKQHGRLYAPLRRAWRIVTGNDKPDEHGRYTSDAEIRAKVERPQLAATLMAKRLAFAARLSSIAPPCLIGLMQIEGAYGEKWRNQLLDDMTAMKSELRQLEVLPWPREDPSAWEDFWRTYPCVWKALVRKFLVSQPCASTLLDADQEPGKRYSHVLFEIVCLGL
jgi:hypothetical protein